jgi:maltose alpha-D-glucosyltransferase/alpha-amylase
VPYLCVREGTNNENLPETHAVLKRIRRELDASFRNRMLLAEANQWPADVRDYFGDGDECHMAFHFPLMPRMFMALKQEDRHPITEILNQTPEIPDSCQWALFLRNHDELTLEMVTDEERDYMYRAYASDPQMRLNVGIRRRLAPLVENSRRRVELLTMLLFSMPGTPIVYYGDEIGMGDNIYLGDRNGVRTPMQWSSDRNGGFSRADTARLYAPPIVDPVYGYQAINVEAQERYPFSLLNWTKRLIALRREHRVFGRGSLEIIYGANRKVLAYLRRYENETVLVVANLSRTLQPVELDLGSSAGLTPVEMLGLTVFPRITDDKPYFLTLGPYAAYWFTLVQQPLQLTQPAPARSDAGHETADSLPALLVGVNWEMVFDSATRQILERQALVPYLKRQRWFASKSRVLRDVRISDWSMLRGGATPAFLTILSASYDDGWTESYVAPFSLVSIEQAERVLAETPHAVLSRITGARKGAIIDAMLDDDACNRLLEMVQQQRQSRSVRGALRGLRELGVEMPADRKWVRPAANSSNSVAFLSERYVLKLFRRVEPGPNPEFELGQALTAQEFPRIAALSGALLYDRPGLEPGTLAVVQASITNQGSGWTFTLDELRRYYERATARAGRVETAAQPSQDPRAGLDGAEPPPFFAALERYYLSAAATLGRRTAELHLALSRATGPAFEPEPLDAAAREALVADAVSHATDVLELLASRRDQLPDAARNAADAVLAGRSTLLARIESIRTLTDAGQRMRVHGDYHLGQVLRTEEDFVIIDFEGEPARTLPERRMKFSPLKDVAGMLRSFNYAAYAALVGHEQVSPGAALQLGPFADTWVHWVSRAFLAAYRETMHDSRVVPRGAAFDELLDALIVEKALYEVGYELNSRPDWARIPLTALASLAVPVAR